MANNDVTKETAKMAIATAMHITDEAELEAEYQRQYAAIDPNSPEYHDVVAFATSTTSSEEERNNFVIQLRNSNPTTSGAPAINPNADVSDTPGMPNPFAPQASNQAAAITTRRRVEYSRPTLSPEAETAIDSLLSSENIAKLKEVMRVTVIEKLLVMKPNPSTYLLDAEGKPVKVVIKVKPENLENYRKNLATDKEGNEAVFNRLVACIENKTPVNVFINDKGNHRVVGCIILNTSTGERRTLTMSTLKAFLMSETAGAIIGRPGVKISQWVSKDRKNNAIARSASMSLKWYGRDQAIDEGKVDYVMSTCDHAKALSLGFDSEFDPEARLRIADIFYVKSRSRSTNKEVIQGKRLTGNFDKMPRFVVRDEYSNLFGQTHRSDKLTLTEAETNQILSQLSIGFSAIAAYEYQPGPEIGRDSKFGQLVNQLRSASRGSVPTAADTGI